MLTPFTLATDQCQSDTATMITFYTVMQELDAAMLHISENGDSMDVKVNEGKERKRNVYVCVCMYVCVYVCM